MDLPGALAARAQVDAPVVMVVAHQDDEILGLGSRLDLIPRLTIIHLTDGAPRDMGDARREGFGRWQDYAGARKAELARALMAAGAGHARTIAYDHPDQDSIRHLDAIVRRLAEDLSGAAAVVTHPYEHGHPDHDAAALAVALACRRLRDGGEVPPVRFEFASYHLREGEVMLGAFWPDAAGAAEIELALDEDELALKRAAMECYATQKALGGRFPLSPERVRQAPEYDFAAPAPPGRALYERWGIAMTLGEWRRLADEALIVVSPAVAERAGAGPAG